MLPKINRPATDIAYVFKSGSGIDLKFIEVAADSVSVSHRIRSISKKIVIGKNNLF